ncbi:5,10-methylenetetrahydromethanopterin reductase [Haloechinothrix alba]|uniref:5,10-methylenetetrahydromethanopterin reductase n=1 Tax=Haloechinothrix alba TaxID=664784 RepID=A0A238Y4H4_9PSEU|nr:5,10-methylenetetrahydromethanopterin reductase [Haloechinothrix alba]
MSLTMSCAFTTSLQTPEHVRIAEELGYERAWLYDSPAVCADVWTQLSRSAERTENISLGPGVLVPSLRHPMVTATAIAELVEHVGQERVVVGVGSGFTGRLALGQRPCTWAYVADYIRALKALLRGERTEWDGSVIEMLHHTGFAAPRPIDVPFVVAAFGPKGMSVASELGDGAITLAAMPYDGFDWVTHIVFGTVLEPGENPGSDRAVDAAGHAASVMLHFAIEFDKLDMIPGGREWASAYDDVPPETRHLTVHDGHLWAVSERDRPFVTGDVLASQGLAQDESAWRDKIAEWEEGGATEIAYQPAGPDVPRELEAFAKAVRN